MTREQLNTNIDTHITNSTGFESISEQEVGQVMKEIADYAETLAENIPVGPQGPAGPQGAGLIPDGFGPLTDALIAQIEDDEEITQYVYVVDPDGDTRADQDIPEGLEGDQSLMIIGYTPTNGWKSYGQFTGVQGPQGIPGTTNVKQVKVVLTPEQILTLKTNPVQLVPASVGKILLPRSVILVASGGTTGYTGVGLLLVKLDYITLASMNPIITNPGDSTLFFSTFTNTGGAGNFDNKPITLTNNGVANPENGNGNLTVYLEYLEITL